MVYSAFHDDAHSQDFQFVLQQEEERERVVKTIHEQRVVLVGDMGVLHKMVDNMACRSKEWPMPVLYPAGVDFCIEDTYNGIIWKQLLLV